MVPIPHDKGLDNTLILLLDGYTFIPKRCERLQSDIFQTRLLFQPFICMRGEAAARVFYDNERFQRRSAAPVRLKKTLLGQGGVQGLDDAAHRWRKQMFMSLMTPEHIAQLADITMKEWLVSIEQWETRDQVVLFDEVRMILCRAVCRWAGVPLPEADVTRRANELEALVEGAGAVGPRHWRGRWARRRTNAWIARIVTQVRKQQLEVAEGTALHTIAWHRDLAGKLLHPRVAAVELLNVLRPTVAVDRFVVFAAHALHTHPACRERLQAGDDDAYLEMFVQEVRRLYPFFPFMVARTRHAFEWNGYHFPKGRKVLLDLYGTNHDAQVWEQPEAFRPERFRHWNQSAFNFIPQGGSDHYQQHRCPGEWITIELMKVAVRLLTNAMVYNVPEQDLRISLRRVPAIPESRFVISNVSRQRANALEMTIGLM